MMVLVEQLEYKARYDGFLFVLAANNSGGIKKKPISVNADSLILTFLNILHRTFFFLWPYEVYSCTSFILDRVYHAMVRPEHWKTDDHYFSFLRFYRR